MALKESEIKVGDTYQECLVENLTRTQIIQYSGASGDYNPMHHDEVFVTQVAGLPKVFAHGLLSMGMTGKMLTNYVGDGRLKTFGVRFTRQVFPGDTLNSKAIVKGIKKTDEEIVVELDLVTTNQNDEVVLSGYATARADS